MVVPSVNVTVWAAVSIAKLLTVTGVAPLRVTVKLLVERLEDCATEASPLPNSLMDKTKLAPFTDAVLSVGAVVSSMTDNGFVPETLPAASVSVAVRVFVASLPREESVMSTYLLVTSFETSIAVPTLTPSLYTVTISPATGPVVVEPEPVPGKETLTVGVTALVLASLLTGPVSEAVVSARVGAAGAVVSLETSVTDLVKVATALPARSRSVLPLPGLV